jgi:hypothetical protein
MEFGVDDRIARESLACIYIYIYIYVWILSYAVYLYLTKYKVRHTLLCL